MGKITIFKEYTTDKPITMIGKLSGVCYNSPIDDDIKNYKRGIHNLNSGHGRTWEFPDVYMIIDGYSARVIRELYTHIGGSPTRVQASTRYIDYAKGFDYITPRAVKNSWGLTAIYDNAMQDIAEIADELEGLGVNKEDVANLLPLGMTTKMVYKINLRTLIDMSHQRKCACAYWEFRELFTDIEKALKELSDEWAYLVDNYFIPKCEYLGYCNEGKRSCGRRPLEAEYKEWYSQFLNDWKKQKLNNA